MHKLIAIMLVIGQLLISCSPGNGIVKNGKGEEVIQEDKYHAIVLFLDDPVKYFPQIRGIHNFFEYVAFIDMNTMSTEGYLAVLFDKHFQEINGKKASILIHLLLLPPTGLYAGEMVDRVEELFESHPYVFLKELQKRRDWRIFVEIMGSGSWDSFLSGVNKLGNSNYEREFKKYVSRYRRNSIN